MSLDVTDLAETLAAEEGLSFDELSMEEQTWYIRGAVGELPKWFWEHEE